MQEKNYNIDIVLYSYNNHTLRARIFYYPSSDEVLRLAKSGVCQKIPALASLHFRTGQSKALKEASRNFRTTLPHKQR